MPGRRRTPTEVAGFQLPDHVDFENLMAIRAEGERYIDGTDEPQFDLSGLADSSSAAAALLVAWFRYAHARGKVAEFENVPPGLMNIMEVTELSEILPLK